MLGKFPTDIGSAKAGDIGIAASRRIRTARGGSAVVHRTDLPHALYVERRGERRFFSVLCAQRISAADGAGALIAAAGSAFRIRKREPLADKSGHGVCRAANRPAAEEGSPAQEGDQEETGANASAGIDCGTCAATRGRAGSGSIRTTAAITLANPLTDERVL